MTRRVVIIPVVVLALVLDAGLARAQFAGLYVSDVSTAQVDQVNMTESMPAYTPVVTGLSDPQGLAISSNSDYLFVADALRNDVYVYQYSSIGSPTLINTINTFPTGSQPTGLALDSSGNLFVTATGGGGSANIYEVSPTGTPSNPNYSTGNTTTTAFADFNPNGTGAAPPQGIVVDSKGNVYTTYDGKIYVVPQGDGFQMTPPLLTPFATINAYSSGSVPSLALNQGNLYATLENTNQIVQIQLSTPSNQTTLPMPSDFSGSGANYPVGLAVDSTGSSLYFATDIGGYIGHIANLGSSPTATDYSSALSGQSLSFAAYAPPLPPGGPGTPEPGSLALGTVIALTGVIGWARKRRQPRGV